MRVGLARGAFLDRDFVLTIGGLSGRSLATVARDGDRYVALASFCADVPRDAATLPLALKLLVDCSGSMGGDSIEAARRALHRILASLDPGDRFSLTRFGGRFVHETSGLVRGSEDNVRRAAQAVGRMDADLGGTEMAQALHEVFTLNSMRSTGNAAARYHARDARRSADVYATDATAADVLLLTDGEVWNADGLIGEARQSRQRVFVVGIGSAPAEGVLRRLAEATGGACEFVAPNEDAEAAILRMFVRMRAPRVERAEIAWPATATWTAPLPSGLFGGETIHAFAAFDTEPVGAAVLKLHSKEGAALLSSAAQLGGTVVEDRTLARIAAARRIETATEAEQLKLALDYGLLTSRTNLLVVHERAEGEKAIHLPQLAQVAQMHAAGWHGVGSVRANVSTVHCDATLPMRSLDSHHHADMDDGSAACQELPAFSALDTFDDEFDDDATLERTPGRHPGDKPGAAPSLVRFVATLARYDESSVPTTVAVLAGLGIGFELLAELRALVAAGAGESVVVKAFLEAVAIWDETRPQPVLSRQMRRTLRHLFGAEREAAALRTAARRIVTDAVAATPA
jgi:Ca-activated chloride channel family protein